MGIDIQGWLEVSRLDQDQRTAEYARSGIISISAVIDFCYEVSQLLFGFSKMEYASSVANFLGEEVTAQPDMDLTASIILR